MRKASTARPLVYRGFLGTWLRTGTPTRYDSWPVLNPLNEYQERLVTRPR
ncbi:Uncharacterised protein [Mycobacteroides abscessus]|nr:hypothetical protein [Mycobacteroides abscessus]CPR84393.1 Uncharacterised protein [Mycobacteroides abscessus]CPS03471.1 Uncharacterised protein [Mycobacteroides abscessus]CPT04153.1 Uncharacterised protein [Mycobacteroides abscessus]CPU33383.1 Uncharacterised protein [Mycobacteroides abscessus]CPV11941.1 Uncharacterised protein [Mycobacteroides abscessus]